MYIRGLVGVIYTIPPPSSVRAKNICILGKDSVDARQESDFLISYLMEKCGVVLTGNSPSKQTYSMLILRTKLMTTNKIF